MTFGRPKRLRMIAGPNGSGKSSVINDLAKERSPNGLFYLNHYLNADDYLRKVTSREGLDLSDFGINASKSDLCGSIASGGRLAVDHAFFREVRVHESRVIASREAVNGYAAAAIVDFVRERLMESGNSFSFETVMSHPSKTDFFERARGEGYKTYLYFVCTEPVELNVARVKLRVSKGGHDVPEDKIRERYERCLRLTRDALARAYRAYFFDNSGLETLWLAEFDPQGECHLQVPPNKLPHWFRKWVWPS